MRLAAQRGGLYYFLLPPQPLRFTFNKELCCNVTQADFNSQQSPGMQQGALSAWQQVSVVWVGISPKTPAMLAGTITAACCRDTKSRDAAIQHDNQR